METKNQKEVFMVYFRGDGERAWEKKITDFAIKRLTVLLKTSQFSI